MCNRERQLRSSVLDILDLTASVSRALKIVVVDDGSTDETYETACELARLYPQLTVLRQPVRQGMGAALELVRRRMAVERVLVHDGVSTIDVAQLQAMLQMESAREHPNESGAHPCDSTTQSFGQSSGSRRFSDVRVLHSRMEQVHRQATCFRWMELKKPLVPRRCQVISPALASPGTTLATGMLATGIPLVKSPARE